MKLVVAKQFIIMVGMYTDMKIEDTDTTSEKKERKRLQ